MMNFVSVFLVLSLLASAGMWYLSPQNDNQNRQKKQGDHQREAIVKNGHKVVVVEYDKHGHPITNVSITLEQDRQVDNDSSISDNDVSLWPYMVSRAFDTTMENIKEAASTLSNGHGLSNGEGHTTRKSLYATRMENASTRWQGIWR